MPLFQSSVLNKYLKEQDGPAIKEAFNKFTAYFHNPTIQENIRESKEEQFQEGFLRELFVKVLGYVINPNPEFNLTTEFKNQTGAKKADGAILKDGVAIGVIELKSTRTKDLEAVRQQAFDYKANQANCTYVVTSNFEKLRFYINNAVDYEEFDLFRLSAERFRILYLCLSFENIVRDTPLHIKEESVLKDEQITKKLYADYSIFKRELFDDLVSKNFKNQLFEGLDEKAIKKTLFKKSQKLLDRFLFIFFAEDRGLLPPNSTTRILNQWTQLKDLDAYVPLYDRFKKYFGYLNTGFKGKEHEIYAYNGGLFKPDEILDSLLINDNMLFTHTSGLTRYNFETEVDVNILGHIFENSLNEIETVNAEIEGVAFEKQTSKRKKDGVFYTPKYITKYIVDNTVGRLCQEKTEELGIAEEDYLKSRKGRKKENLKALDDKLKTYRDWLLQITICDPACGSGAFLNQALNFLIEEHHYIDQLSSTLLDLPMVFRNVENSILENNLFGVDLNEESVDIARLSLWLRTAQKGRKLTTLSSNIKCGNSLIDDPEVAGEKAFHWQKEFPEIFEKKEKGIFHITTATHDSRTSQRMIDHKVRLKRDHGQRPKAQPIWLESEDELLITETIAEIVEKDNLNILAYNICGDHMHLLLVCEEIDMPKIVQKIKSVTAKIYNRSIGKTKAPSTTSPTSPSTSPSSSTTTREHAPLSKQKEKHISLWTQKFGCNEIENDKQMWNTVEYIKTNREKHELPTNKGLQPLVDGIGCDYDHAFRTEHKGGFDVVIGNPPYLRVQGLRENFEKESEFYEKYYKSATGRFDVYVLFMEKSFELIKTNGTVSFILPHKFLVSDFGEGIRKFFVENKGVESILHFGSEMVFADASTYTCVINLSLENASIKFKQINPNNIFDHFEFDSANYDSLSEAKWSLKSENVDILFKKLNSQPWTVMDVFSAIRTGVDTGTDDLFIMKGEIRGDEFFGFSERLNDIINIEASLVKPLLKGKDARRYDSIKNDHFVIYSHHLINEKTVPFEEDDFMKIFPKTYNYLLPYKDELVNKKIHKKTNPKYWYSLHRARESGIFEQVKIITPETSLGGNMTIDTDEFYHNTQVYSLIKKESIKEEYKFWISILNSNLFWFYLQSTGAVLRGGYFRFKTKYLEPFPLPKLENIEQQNPFIEKTDFILLKTKEFTYSRDKFIKYFQSQFQLDTVSKKLQNWYKLEFGEFIKELNKAIKKESKRLMHLQQQGSMLPCPVDKLTKLQEMDWMEVFETKNQKPKPSNQRLTKPIKKLTRWCMSCMD